MRTAREWEHIFWNERGYSVERIVREAVNERVKHLLKIFQEGRMKVAASHASELLISESDLSDEEISFLPDNYPYEHEHRRKMRTIKRMAEKEQKA
jgi:hypothetical protein